MTPKEAMMFGWLKRREERQIANAQRRVVMEFAAEARFAVSEAVASQVVTLAQDYPDHAVMLKVALPALMEAVEDAVDAVAHRRRAVIELHAAEEL